MKSILKEESEVVATGNSKKEICWGDMVIYEFDNILGDNPAVSEGAPLSIHGKPINESTIAIDYYEFVRESRPRRRRKHLVMSSGARDTFLLGRGYKLDDLIKAAEETKKIRDSRRSNMKGTWDKFRSLYETATSPLRKKMSMKPQIVAAKSG